MQEDLAKLFSQNMRFSNSPNTEAFPCLSSREDTTQRDISRATTPPTYSISQHYHHSAHLVPKAQLVEETHMETHTSSPLSSQSVEAILTSNGIDPSNLLPSQITLFDQASSDQKHRLIELWQISPPEYTYFGVEELADELGDWQRTTFEQEEEMAGLRFNRKQTQVSGAQDDIEASRERHVANIGLGEIDFEAVEPYITSGYEMLAQRDYDHQSQLKPRVMDTYSPLGSAVGGGYEHSTDPAFQSRQWWRHDYIGQQPIEYQYGRFDQMNQFRAPMHVSAGASGEEDEEML